jgi:hypothetical protein
MLLQCQPLHFCNYDLGIRMQPKFEHYDKEIINSGCLQIVSQLQ